MFAWRRQVSPTSFINFNTTTSSPTPFLLSQESTRSPSHRIILRFALDHACIGAGDSSGRVPPRHTAFHNSSLCGSSHLFLHRIDACASFGRFTSAFVATQNTRATSTASVSPFRGSIFFVLDCASCPSSSQVLLIYSFLGMALCANTSIRCRFRIPLF